MPVAIDVDSEVFVSAGGVFIAANRHTCDTVTAVSQAVDAGRGMAGTDSGGVAWASTYDRASAPAVAAGSTLVDALGHVGELLGRSADNHTRAEAASERATRKRAATAHGVAEPPLYPVPASTAPGAHSIIVSAPPSANGTDDDPPAGWFLVADLLQYTWPNGHQDRLRNVATGWRTGADALGRTADGLTPAIGAISTQRSPEVEPAVSTCTAVQLGARDLAEGYRLLAGVCDDYAAYLDQAHAEVISELVEFAAESAIIQIVAAAAAVPSGGGSEVVGQGVQLAKTAATAARISRILQRLLELVTEATQRLEPIVSHVLDVDRRLRKVLEKAAQDVDASLVAVATTPVVPVVDLPIVEATGKGKLDPHTIDRHVGKSDDWLKARARDERRPKTSTFRDLGTAERAITECVRRNDAELQHWLDDPGADAVLSLAGPLSADAGRVYVRATNTVVPPDTIIVRLLRTSFGYTVLTSFPEIRS